MISPPLFVILILIENGHHPLCLSTTTSFNAIGVKTQVHSHKYWFLWTLEQSHSEFLFVTARMGRFSEEMNEQKACQVGDTEIGWITTLILYIFQEITFPVTG
jgi:hypothetical protein